jgi:sugar phosphate isomerase/epimerase
MKSTIGINLPNTCHTPETARKFLSSFVKDGYDAAEVCIDTWPLIVDGEICEPWVACVESMLAEFPLKYSAHIGRGLDLRDTARKERHRAVLKCSIDICARLKLSPLVLHYEIQSKNYETERYFLQAHRDFADYAGSKGVLLVVENIEVEVVEPVIELVAAVDSPALRMNFDTGHAFLASHYFGFDFMDAFKKSIPWLAHLHLSDNTGVFEELRLTDRPTYDALPMGYRFEYGRGDIHLPPYFGKIPYDDIFALIPDYKGMYVCEFYVERFLPLLGFAQQRVRERIGKVRGGL